MNGKIKVLMIGGTGIISNDCTLLALRKPHIDLWLLNRGKNPSFLPEGIQVIQADINDSETVRKKLHAHEFDVVCDFISYDPESLNRKLELLAGKCKQYIFISSCAAYKKHDHFMLRTEANSPTGNLLWSYGYNKTLCERLLIRESKKHDMSYTIVRPSYTYNHIRLFSPYTINHWESWTNAHRILTGKPIVVYNDCLYTLTHTSDFAKAFVGLWGNPKAQNEDFHITAHEYLSYQQIARIQADILGVEVKFCQIGVEELCMELNWNATEKIRYTSHSECYDSTKVRQAVPEFECTTNFREGAAETIRFYLENPQFQKINTWWDGCFDRIVKKYGR